MPIKSNKTTGNLRWYENKLHPYKCSMDIIIPIGIYCYFGFDLIEKLRSFRVTKRKASINATQYVRNLPKERTFAKHFSQDIFPSSVGIDCKGNTFFAYKQIEKYFLLEILIYTCIYSKKIVTLQTNLFDLTIY